MAAERGRRSGPWPRRPRGPSLRHPLQTTRIRDKKRYLGDHSCLFAASRRPSRCCLALKLNTKMALATARIARFKAAFCRYGRIPWRSRYAAWRPIPHAFRTCVAGRPLGEPNGSPHLQHRGRKPFAHKDVGPLNREDSLDPLRSEVGPADCEAGGLLASGHGRISRPVR